MWSFRFFDHWCSRQKLRLFAVDGLSLAGGFLLGSGIARQLMSRPALSPPVTLLCALLFALALQSALYLADLYDLDAARFPERQASRLSWALAGGLAGFAALALAVAWRFELAALSCLLSGAAVGLLFLLAARASMRRWLGRPARILVVGDAPRAERFCRLIQDHFQFQQVARLDWRALPRHLGDGAGPEGTGALDLEAALIEPPSQIEEALLRHVARRRQEAVLDPGGASRGFDLVVLAVDEASRGPGARTLLGLKLSGIPVFEAATFIERTQRRLPVELLRPDELVFARGFGARPLDRALRRALDLMASLCLLAVAAPLLALAALAIRIDSRGPVFYRQERVGLGGRRFLLTKLRTMRVDAEREGAPQWAQVNDSRVTRVGRFLRKCRIDELPQIFSVLRGEMSFVGPRPERAFFVEQLAQQIPFYRLRLIAKPGITGWAQVRYPYGASVEDARAKLEYDLYYLKNRSLFLDLSIIFHTVGHVVMG